ncbi:MAG: binding-protein-dependent transport system inner rane component, partial [Polaromonas sp.]|nr:binding-protein-dependent transport system inner rane component [Polaromonas sp.]
MSTAILKTKFSAAPAPTHPLREFWSYFSANRGAVMGLVIVVTVLLVALFAPWLAPHA